MQYYITLTWRVRVQVRKAQHRQIRRRYNDVDIRSLAWGFFFCLCGFFGVFGGFWGRGKRKALVVGSGVGAEEESVFLFFGRFAITVVWRVVLLVRVWIARWGFGCWVSWEREKEEGGQG